MKKTTRLLTTIICLCVAVTMLFGLVLPASANTVVAASSKTESVRYDSYEQYLAYYYLTYSALDFHLNTDGLPYHTYVDNCRKRKIASTFTKPEFQG